MVLKSIAAVAALAGLTLVAQPAAATPLSDSFTSFYSFGDSLSDDGKLAAINTAFNSLGGRFSDGPVWAELLEDQFIAAGKDTGNFAIGGATALDDPTPSTPLADLSSQIGAFQGSVAFGLTTPGANPLMSFWAGANDILGAFAAGTDVLAAAVDAANAVADRVAALAGLGTGFDDFLIANLPDLGRTPLFISGGFDPLASAATAAYNSTLSARVALLRAAGVNIYDLDAFGLLNAALDDPAAFGYASTTVPCILGYTVDPTPVGCASFAPSQLLFADSIHPNGVAHQNLAAAAETAVMGAVAVPLPASASMILAALAALGAVGLRRRRAVLAPSPLAAV